MGCEKSLISVVIPSYNDKEIIKVYHDSITECLSNQDRYHWELLYVDDGSTDGSVDVLSELVQKDDKIVFLELNANFGQQKAFYCGLRESKGDIVVTLDGDYQYPPEVILQLADAMTERNCDIVSGIRQNRCDPFFGKLTSRAGQWFVRKIISKGLTDFGSVKCFSRSLVDSIVEANMYSTQVYGLAYKLTNKYHEIDVEHLPRYSGTSKWTFWKRIDMYIELFLLFGEVNFRTSFLLSLAMMAVGSGYLSFVLLYRYLFHTVISSGIGGIVVFTTGLLLLFFSISLSVVLKVYKTVSLGGIIAIRTIHKK